MSNKAITFTLRRADQTDAAELARLAQRDSAPAPTGEVLLVESDGEIRAALELASGQVVADPFAPTSEHVALLRARARQLSAAPRRRLRLVARTPALSG